MTGRARSAPRSPGAGCSTTSTATAFTPVRRTSKIGAVAPGGCSPDGADDAAATAPEGVHGQLQGGGGGPLPEGGADDPGGCAGPRSDGELCAPMGGAGRDRRRPQAGADEQRARGAGPAPEGEPGAA